MSDKAKRIVFSNEAKQYDKSFLSKMLLIGEDRRTTKQRLVVKSIVKKYFY